MATIVITDIAWPSPAIESELAHANGHEILLAESDEHLLTLAPQADAILTCFRRVPAEVLDAADRCLTVARYGVGVDNIDVAHATELGILVSNVPEFCTEEVADHTLALTLATLRNLLPATDATRGGGWTPEAAYPSRRLRGLVFGIVGLRRDRPGGGRARRGVRVRGRRLVARARGRSRCRASVGGPRVDRDELLGLRRCRVAPCPAQRRDPSSRRRRELGMMKDGALLINVGRGGLVDTEALRPELERGRLRVALDVTDPEPLPADHWLRSSPAAIITPHVAFASDGSLIELATKATSNALAVLAGRRPPSIVNPEVLTSDLLRFTAQ